MKTLHRWRWTVVALGLMLALMTGELIRRTASIRFFFRAWNGSVIYVEVGLAIEIFVIVLMVCACLYRLVKFVGRAKGI